MSRTTSDPPPGLRGVRSFRRIDNVRLLRPSPNTRATWFLAVVAATTATVNLYYLFASTSMAFLDADPVPTLIVGAAVLIGNAMAWMVARVDASTLGQRTGSRVSPWIALLSPLVYLGVRAFFHSDLRSARPFWFCVSTCLIGAIVVVLIFVGRYGMWQLGVR